MRRSFLLPILFLLTGLVAAPAGQVAPTPTQGPGGNDRMDAEGRMNAGRQIVGKLVPAPGYRLRVDLYRADNRLLDSCYSGVDGIIRFLRPDSGARYQLRIRLGPGREYVEQLPSGLPMSFTVQIRPEAVKRSEALAAEAGSGLAVTFTSLEAPKEAVKEVEKARELLASRKFEQAAGHLRKATDLYPRYAEAFNELGLALQQQDRLSDAQKAFEQAISIDPGWVTPYLNLGSLEMATSQAPQLVETSSKLLTLDPGLPRAHFLHAAAMLSEGKLEAAEKSALRAEQGDHADIPQLHLVLARIYLNKGEAPAYANQLRLYLKENPKAPNAGEIRAELEKLK